VQRLSSQARDWHQFTRASSTASRTRTSSSRKAQTLLLPSGDSDWVVTQRVQQRFANMHIICFCVRRSTDPSARRSCSYARREQQQLLNALTSIMIPAFLGGNGVVLDVASDWIPALARWTEYR